MNHEEAVHSGAVERYLLDEMTEPQREAFEEHYFGCTECALDLKTAAAFLEGAKRELKRAPRPGGARPMPRNRWTDWLWRPAVAGPAFAMLLLIIVYQQAAVPPRVGADAPAPEVLTLLPLIGSGSRGGPAPAAALGRAAGPLILTVDVPTADRFASYECDLIGPAGGVLWRLPVTASQARDTVAIRVPPANLTGGDYRLIVRGQAASAPAEDLATYRFTLTRSE